MILAVTTLETLYKPLNWRYWNVAKKQTFQQQ